MTGRRVQRGNRAQTMRDTSFGPLVLLFFLFGVISTGIICVMELWMDLQEVTMRRTGPNDCILCHLGHL